MKIDIGIEATKRGEIAAGLSRVLADTLCLGAFVVNLFSDQGSVGPMRP